MLKYILLSLSLLTYGSNYGQYKNYPKLESLFNTGKYDKCLEKSEMEIQFNKQEIFPYIWQMKCYLAIDESPAHPLKKQALSRALNNALKIEKKDVEDLLIDKLKPDYKTIADRNVLKISTYTEPQYQNGMAVFEKLKKIDGSLSLEYKKFLYMKKNNDPAAFLVLKNIVVNHYGNFKKNVLPLENMEVAYADMMEAYFKNHHPEYAREVYIKASEIYGDSKLCKEVYIGQIRTITSEADLSTEESTLNFYLQECLIADSLLNDPSILPAIHLLKKHLAIAVVQNQNPANKKSVQPILEYLSLFSTGQYDSTNTFFRQLLNTAETQPQNQHFEKHILFNYWIAVLMEIRNQKQAKTSILHIHQCLLAWEEYEDDIDFLEYCNKTYPNLKSTIEPLSAALDKQLVVYVSNPESHANIDRIDEYARKTNNKTLKDKRYQLYINRLSELLVAGNFSGFAVTIVKALNQFPDDPQILSLKKQWIIKDFKVNYQNTGVGYDRYFTKLPDETECEPGIVNKAGHDIVLQAINYFRRLAGVPDSCVFDEALNAKCQKAALMMSANGSLNHSPPKKWKCYTLEGAGAASASNLSLGHAFQHALMGQIDDDGTFNTACGHRRWLLNPVNTVFGHGSTLNATSIHVFGTSDRKLKREVYFNAQQPICWPSADYFPINLMPQRWSFSLSDAEFENAKVVVIENGKAIPITIEPLSYGYGPNTLVWVFKGNIKAGQVYKVTISNVMTYPSVNGSNTKKAKTFTYNVIPIEIK